MIIRRVIPIDAEEIYKLRLETIKKINSKDYNNKEIEGFKKLYSKENILNKIKTRDMFCAVENDIIIGTIDLENNKIGGFFVKPSHTNKGIGKELLKFIENYAKNKGIKEVRLFSTKTAYDFYLKQGYKPSDTSKEDLPFITAYFNKKMIKNL